jgi:hypothetical protein
MRQRMLLIAACLAVIFPVLSWADESKSEIVFELGQDPTGDLASLPDWAPGNLAVSGFDSRTRTLSIEVNILPELLQKDQEKSYALQPGELATVALKNGVRFMFFHKCRSVKTELKMERDKEEGGPLTYSVEVYQVTLIVRKLSGK